MNKKDVIRLTILSWAMDDALIHGHISDEQEIVARTTISELLSEGDLVEEVIPYENKITDLECIQVLIEMMAEVVHKLNQQRSEVSVPSTQIN